jgi:hypothetical protein
MKKTIKQGIELMINPENRMYAVAWKFFSGWCGHQQVPGETNRDPCTIDIDTFLL